MGEMVIKLFGSPDSTCTARVMVCMEELGLQYELVPVDLKAGEHERPPHTDRNPFGQIPALQDGDLVLFESRVITRYLVKKYGMWTDLLKEWSFVDSVAVDQWMEVEIQHFNLPIYTIVLHCYVLPLLLGGHHLDDDMVYLIWISWVRCLMFMRPDFQRQFLAGDFYSLADLHHLPYGHYLITNTPYGSLINSRPHVKAWWDVINSRPSSKKVIAAMSFPPARLLESLQLS